MAKRLLHLVNLRGLPIYEQLILEEALLRNTKSNWMLINDGAVQPAIVMGISGKAEELINIPAAKTAGIQVIRRFTGGGTVVVDHDTIFTSLIMQAESLPHVECYPRPIMSWTEAFYTAAFKGMHVQGKTFGLRENDYVFGDLKFGGNAQSITGRRWLHHTSLLWKYQQHRMALLAQPKRAPDYRQGRTHGSFLVPLSQAEGIEDSTHIPSDLFQAELVDRVPERLRDITAADTQRDQGSLSSSRHGSVLQDTDIRRRQFLSRLVHAAQQLEGFAVQECALEEASCALQGSSICGTKLIDLKQYISKTTSAAGVVASPSFSI